MGIRIGNLAWMNNYSKKQCRSLFWRIRAALKKDFKIKNGGNKHQFTFHYDPSSYALNFDDGLFELGERTRVCYQAASSKLPLNCPKSTTRIYVIWVEF